MARKRRSWTGKVTSCKQSHGKKIKQNIDKNYTKKPKEQLEDQLTFPDELNNEVRLHREEILAAFKALKKQKAAGLMARAEQECCGE